MAFFDTYTQSARYKMMQTYLTKALPCKDTDHYLGMSCLNAGGGYGYAHGMLQEMGFSVTTGDIEPGQYQDCAFLDLEKPLPFADNAFDVVVCLAVLEHLDNWDQALHELSRVAKYAVVATTPSIYGKPILDGLALCNLVNKAHIADHKHYLTREEITRAGYSHRYFQGGLNQVLWRTQGSWHQRPFTISDIKDKAA